MATFEQRRVVGHGCFHFRIGSSRSSSPDLDRRELTASRNSQKDPEASPVTTAHKGKGQTGGTPTTTGSTPGVESGGRPDGRNGEPGRSQAEGTGKSSKRRSREDRGRDRQDGDSGAENSVPGPKTPPTPPTRPKAKSRPLTEEQKAVADEVLAQKARDLLKAADLKRGTGTLEEEKPSTASGSGAKRVPKYLAHLTDEEREKLFRSELASERQAGAIEWEKELNRQAKEEEERRKAKALYRSERMAQALEHGKEVQRRRQEEFEKGKQDLLQWRAEEEDRENLRKARRISLEQPAVPPTAGGVVLTPAPKAISEPTVMVGESPATPPEALQAPLSEEEITASNCRSICPSFRTRGKTRSRTRCPKRPGSSQKGSRAADKSQSAFFESSIRRRAQKGSHLHR